MLLPQSTAFEKLKNRLNSVSSLGVLHLIPKKYGSFGELELMFISRSESISESTLKINFDQLLDHFLKLQQMHSSLAKQQRKSKTVDQLICVYSI
jgi:vacuole morphology and inheritance protein 14